MVVVGLCDESGLVQCDSGFGFFAARHVLQAFFLASVVVFEVHLPAEFCVAAFVVDPPGPRHGVVWGGCDKSFCCDARTRPVRRGAGGKGGCAARRGGDFFV